MFGEADVEVTLPVSEIHKIFRQFLFFLGGGGVGLHCLLFIVDFSCLNIRGICHICYSARYGVEYSLITDIESFFLDQKSRLKSLNFFSSWSFRSCD